MIETGSIPGIARDLSRLHNIQTRSDSHPVSYQICIGDFSPEIKRPERESGYAPPSRGERSGMVS